MRQSPRIQIRTKRLLQRKLIGSGGAFSDGLAEERSTRFSFAAAKLQSKALSAPCVGNKRDGVTLELERNFVLDRHGTWTVVIFASASGLTRIFDRDVTPDLAISVEQSISSSDEEFR